ncbi:MAG TPA: ArsR family transcriptional regulator, partial [Brevibacillus sp.]|nr:ArsR family transcriptional regulator [Brevibacillus sp.]
PFRTTEKDLLRTLNRLVASDHDVRKEYKNTFAFNLAEFYLSQEERNQMVEEISALIQKYKAYKNEPGRRKLKYFNILFPLTPADPADDQDDNFEDTHE